MELSGGCCVLQQGLSCGMHDGRRAKGGEGGFVKATQDEFFLAGIGVDVAHRKNAGHIGGVGFGIDHQLFALHGQTPLGDGAEFGREAQASDELLRRAFDGLACGCGNADGLQIVCAAMLRRQLTNLQLQLTLRHCIAHGFF